MPWYAVLIVALAGLAVVLGFIAWLALKGWRLAKHGMAVSRRIAPLANGLTKRADEITAAAARLADDGDQLTQSLAKMQASLARLQVVAGTMSEAMEPFLLLTGWLAGDKGYNDWRRWSRAHPR